MRTNIQKKQIAESELVLNSDKSIYHLHLKKEDVADTLIFVGDQERVSMVSKHFDSIEVKIGNREFHTHTGYIGKKRLTVLSTGIGTDNIDIVINELDALCNINFETKTISPNPKSLNIIRIGTSGTFQKEIGIDSFLVSEMAVGLDALMHFYEKIPAKKPRLEKAISGHIETNLNTTPYFSYSDDDLLKLLGKDFYKGITVTCPGFYAPQGRVLRGTPKTKNLLTKLAEFKYEDRILTNFEMETAGIYGLSNLFNHKAVSFNAILANRATGRFSKNPQQVIENLITSVLESISTNL